MIEIQPYSLSSSVKGAAATFPVKSLVGENLYGRLEMFYKQTPSSTRVLQGVVLFGLIFASGCGGPLVCVAWPLVLIFVGIGWPLIWFVMVGPHLDRPHLTVSAEELAPGEELRLVYQQGVRKDVTFEHVKIELVMREWVRYRCGTDTCTIHHDAPVQEKAYNDNEVIAAGGDFEKRVIFQVPVTAMHTVIADNNRIVWLIKITLDMVGHGDYTDVYEVRVKPVLNTQGAKR